MTSNPPAVKAPREKPAAMFTCKSCRQRKRKCSREKPACQRCVRLAIPCVYELPPKHLIRSVSTGTIEGVGADSAGGAGSAGSASASASTSVSVDVSGRSSACSTAGAAGSGLLRDFPAGFMHGSALASLPTLEPTGSLDTDTRISGQPLKVHFHTTLDLDSHLHKDPFLLEFAASCVACGPQLARNPQSSGLGHAWFSLTVQCHDLLVPRLNSLKTPSPVPSLLAPGTPRTRAFQGPRSEDFQASCAALIADISSALPSMQAIETYKVQFYQNVYTAVPVLNIQTFERSFQDLVVGDSCGAARLKFGSADHHPKITHLVILLMAIRMGYVCLCLYNDRVERDALLKKQTELWLRQNAVPRDVLLLVKRCLELLDVYENPSEDILCCLIYLRQILLLERSDGWSLIGVTNAELLEATVYLASRMNLYSNAIDTMTEGATTVQEKLYRRKLWLSICSISLHEHTLRGGEPFVKARQLRQFSDHYQVFDDYRAISLRELPLDDQIELDYHIMLLKNHQFMEVLCDIEESHPSNVEFLDNKVHENERLALFFKDGFPDADPAYKIDVNLPLYLLCNSGHIPVRIGSVKQIAVFQTRFALLIKQLSNSSLLMFYYEKEYKFSNAVDSLYNFERHLFDSMKILLQLFEYYRDYAFGRLAEVTPSAMRYILANTMSPIFNRTTLVIHGIILRFVYLQERADFERDLEKAPLLQKIVSQLRALVVTSSDCMKMEFLPPKSLDLNRNFIRLLDARVLLISTKQYAVLDDIDLEKQHDAMQICGPGYADYYNNAVTQLSLNSLGKFLQLLESTTFNKKSDSPMNIFSNIASYSGASLDANENTSSFS
ncbi:Zn(II)2Cys6 transcription factor [Lachancea thermotolerans CBS 6340]|uniref:KLTH0E06116p n=1 Tax=Lachancea thermotolerans (strain ATCC 56472 / CBS 6340 / NRRL Y-8284) TaxID=559295 RepID=C5DHQ0_LACTC|nr:KLTH0E06116p [Lachancea thermotolerans CBS 6340]CAR23311.1 KLTH0E06116p [Lachancea thermotolerans CBS 6340]